MKDRASVLAAVLLVVVIAGTRPSLVHSQSTSLILGYSGSGISTDLRRVMDLEKIWEKHGLSVKSVYFNSGSVLTQAMAGGNIVVSDSAVMDTSLIEEVRKSGFIDKLYGRAPKNER